MELQLELELGLEAEMEAGMGDGAATTQTSRITAWPPQNPGLGPKRRFEALEAIPVSTFGGFWGHFQNPKMGLRSLRQAIQSRFSLGILIKS